MNVDRIAAMLRSLSTVPSRRGVVALLAGAAASGLPGLGAVSGAPKKRRKRKGKKKKKKRRDELTLAPLPAPGPIFTYQCPGPSENIIGSTTPGTMRIAQVFTASRSGTLWEIQFEISNTAGTMGDYLVELLEAANDIPTNTVLAARSIANSSVPVGPTTLIATFNGPQLDAGTQYAPALSRPGGTDLQVGRRFGNDCTGLPYTQDPSGTGEFVEHTFVGRPSFITSVSVLP